jgi:hypothetical protein
LAALGVLLLACPLRVGAQPPGEVSVHPVQDLAFGTLRPGVVEGVSPRDGSRRAEVEIRGKGSYLLEVLLPPVMTSAAGFSFPLRFNPGDGVVHWLKSGTELPLNPTSPYALVLPPNEKGALIWLGGTALPPTGQPPGAYSASITLRVTQLGT